ncbi:acyltransferase [Bacteroides gallinaceum]|uniref:Acyltransferase n=1 Tax=Bacteroides gallinaceum TaxID=1462571 RepID=A0ABT7X9Y9_9BACE|nr:acyltransferase [Bacteroides gallinaceum]MDN0050900.1 acyltransferase [Bacteroides gallinaceum]
MRYNPIARFLRIPRRLRMIYYIHWNRLKFSFCGIKFEEEMNVYNKIYVNVHPTAQVSIGHNFTFSSGAAFNPLSRNIRGCIFAEAKSNIIIGDNVGISSATLWAKESVQIGNNVKIGSDCILLDTDAHNLDYIIRRDSSRDTFTAKSTPIIIEDDVLIGTRCIILKGVTIGARSVIGSGSIVTKSIPADCIAAGNPCKVIKVISE